MSLFLRCAIINDDPDCLTQTVKCWGMEGRFINFYRSSDETGYVQLCEVRVYGGRNPVHHYMIMKRGDGCTSTTVGKTSLVNGQMLMVLIAQLVVRVIYTARVYVYHWWYTRVLQDVCVPLVVQEGTAGCTRITSMRTIHEIDKCKINEKKLQIILNKL